MQTPPSGPVAEYSFDEGKGETVADLSGNEHTATIEEGEWAKGRYGGAINFKGGGGTKCLTVPSASDLELSEEFTLEAWVRAEGGIWGDPVVVKEAEGETSFGLGLGSREEGQAEAFIGEGGGSSSAIGNDEVRQYAWTHLAATYDGAKLRIYVDGALAGTETAPTPPVTGAGALKIGCDIPDGQFTGRIDEVRVYDRALGEAEVQADKAPIQTPQQGPVAAYSFDAGTGETAEDVTADEHDGTIEGAEWTTHGRFGGALEFNASEEDVVKVPDSPDLDFTEEFTLEAWVRPSGEENKFAPLIDKQIPGGGAEGVGYYLYEGGAVSDRPIAAASKEQELIHADDPLDAHAWSHVALTFDGDRTRLYVNGVLVDNGAGEPITTTEGDLEIGGSTETGEYFDGRIDEVRIYDRALDPGEMAVNEGNGLQTPQRTPVAAYSFDANAGETAEDITINEHDGAIEGPTWTDRGKYGAALSFNGEGEDCVTVPESEDLQLTEELTLEAWVKPSGPTEDDPIIFKESLGIGGVPSYAMGIGVTNAGKPEGIIGDEAISESVESPSKIESDVWTHLAFTYDGAYMRLYVNGALVASEKEERSPPSAPGHLRIGCSAPWYEEGFDGKIDEVRIYNRALSAGEVGVDAAVPLQIPQKTPIAEYSFDAGEGTTLEDTSGNGHNGTIEGGPDWSRGRYGEALNFGGEENECVIVPDAEDLRTTEEFTMEAWVKRSIGGGEGPILFKDAWGTGAADELGIGIYGADRPEGFIGEGGGESESVAGAEAIESNVWTHLAFTYDGAHMRLYVNGDLVATQAQASGPQWAEGPLAIGCNPDYRSEVFDGKIDEVRIYDRALSVGEIIPDLTPPTAPTSFSSVLEDEEGDATISWNGSTDPADGSGAVPSGVKQYLVRYKPSGSAWSNWEEALGPIVGIAGASEKEQILVQAVAEDDAGNQSQLTTATVEPKPTEVTVETMAEAPSLFSEGRDEQTAEISMDSEPVRAEPPLAEASFINEEKLCEGRGSNPCGHYQGFLAAQYAYHWTFPGASDSEMEKLHNHEFQFFGGRGGDCANFVSQSMYYGGMEFMGTHGHNNPDEEAGGHDNSAIYELWEGSWWSAYHYNFKKPPKIFDGPTPAWWNSHELYKHLLEFGLAVRLTHNQRPRPGDLIFFNQGEGIHTQNIDHVQMVTRVKGTYVQVSQHSNSYHKPFFKIVQKLERKYHQKPGVEKWNYFVLEPRFTAANLHEKGIFHNE